MAVTQCALHFGMQWSWHNLSAISYLVFEIPWLYSTLTPLSCSSTLNRLLKSTQTLFLVDIGPSQRRPNLHSCIMFRWHISLTWQLHVCVCIFFHREGFFRLHDVQDILEDTDQRFCVVSISWLRYAKFHHCRIWKRHISPPKTKTPAALLLERKRYDINCSTKRLYILI